MLNVGVRVPEKGGLSTSGTPSFDHWYVSQKGATPTDRLAGEAAQTLWLAGWVAMTAGGHSTETPLETDGMPFVKTVAIARPAAKPETGRERKSVSFHAVAGSAGSQATRASSSLRSWTSG
jgi:hypothetical protein